MDLSYYKIVIITINIQSIILSSLLALGIFISREETAKKLLFLDLLIFFSLIQCHMAFYEAGLLNNYTLLQQIIIPAIYGLGPVMYLFALFSIKKDFTIRAQHLFHYIPAVLSLTAAIVLSAMTSPSEIGIYSGFFYNQYTLLLAMGGGISFIAYLVVIFFLFKKNRLFNISIFKHNPETTLFAATYLLLIIAVILDVLSMILQSLVLLEAAILTITLIIIMLFLVNFKYPLFYKSIRHSSEKEKVKRSYLNNIDLHSLEEKLERLMNDEKIFLDESISLATTARKLELSEHQLSQYLNTYKKSNFNTFINTYRIEEAKRLLKERPDESILAIAYEVGFTSKSTFNNAFIKLSNISPSGFREISL